MIESDREYWRWRLRVWRATDSRHGERRAELESMLEAARKEIAGRGTGRARSAAGRRNGG